MIEVAPLSAVPSGSMLRVDKDGRRLCLINVEGHIYILDDRCSHADYSLSEGTLDIDEKEVECPKHGAIFDVTTGNPRSLPATRPVAKYEAVVENDIIYIRPETEF